MEAKLLGIFISVHFSGGGHLVTIWPQPSALRNPKPNNNPGGITAPPINKQMPKNSPRNMAASNLTQKQSPTHQRDRNQLPLPMGRHQSLPSGRLQQALIPNSGTRGEDTEVREATTLLSAKR